MNKNHINELIFPWCGSMDAGAGRKLQLTLGGDGAYNDMYIRVLW